jgi:Tol biopolymer transport system component
VVFYSGRGGTQDVWVINADGSGLDRLTETTGGVWHPSFSPDGTRVAYYDVEAGRAVIIEAGKSWKEQSPQVLPEFEPASRFSVFSWSPDGRRLVGVQHGPARFQGVLTYSFGTQQFEKLTEFGRDPVWLADSRRIVFHDWQEKIYLVDSQSKVAKVLLSVAPNSLGRGVSVSADNRTIYFSLEQEEADIWLATAK